MRFAIGYFTSLAAALLTASLAGCVALEVNPVSSANNAQQRTGVEYRLSFTQFKGKLVRRLTKCEPTPEIAIVVEDASAVAAPDWSQRYVLDHTTLSHAFKTSSLEIKRYPNGQLQSINAKAEDRSAATIGSMVTTALKFFTPIDAAAGGGDPARAQVCTDKASQTLLDVGASKTRLKHLVADTERLTKNLQRLTDQLQLASNAADSRLRKALSRAALDLQKAKDRQDAEQARLARLLNSITVTEEFLWPENADDQGPFLMPFPPNQAGEWFTSAWSLEAAQNSCAQLWLERTHPETKPSSNTDSSSDFDLSDPKLGIRYRESEPGALVIRRAPVPVTIRVPDKGPVANSSCSLIAGNEEFRLSGDVLQFGRIMVLPFSNHIFLKNHLEATWDEVGRLTMVSYGEDTATAEVAANLAGTVTDAVRSTVSARREEELGDLKAENARLEAQIKNLELQAKLSPPIDPNREALANLDADRRLADAERAAIEAELALRAARAQLDGS